MSRKLRAMKKAARARADGRPRCGLGGKTDNLTKTEC